MNEVTFAMNVVSQQVSLAVHCSREHAIYVHVATIVNNNG